MVWKIYKLMAVILLRLAARAVFSRDTPGGAAVEMQNIYRLNRIIDYVREYYGLHPAYVKSTYGSIDSYLKQHLCEQDWILLAQLQVVKPAHKMGRPVFDVA